MGHLRRERCPCRASRARHHPEVPRAARRRGILAHFHVLSPYLFPGARAGRHITREQLKAELNSRGVDVLATKNTALDELVAAMPAPMVADALGYSYTALGKHEQHRGVRYRGHAAGACPNLGPSQEIREPTDWGRGILLNWVMLVASS